MQSCTAHTAITKPLNWLEQEFILKRLSARTEFCVLSTQQSSLFVPKVTVVFKSILESYFHVGSIIPVLLYPLFILLFLTLLNLFCKSHSTQRSNVKFFWQDKLVLNIFQKTLQHPLTYRICPRWHRKPQG